jgi:hypothetical protein
MGCSLLAAISHHAAGNTRLTEYMAPCKTTSLWKPTNPTWLNHISGV